MKRIAVVAMLVAACGMASAERLVAPDGTTKDVPEASVPYALKDGYKRIEKVMMRDTSGEAWEVDVDGVNEMLARGWWKMTEAEASDWRYKRASEHVGRISRELEEERDSERNRAIALGLGISGALAVALYLASRSNRRHAGK